MPSTQTLDHYTLDICTASLFNFMKSSATRKTLIEPWFSGVEQTQEAGLMRHAWLHATWCSSNPGLHIWLSHQLPKQTHRICRSETRGTVKPTLYSTFRILSTVCGKRKRRISAASRNLTSKSMLIVINVSKAFAHYDFTGTNDLKGSTWVTSIGSHRHS